MSLFAYYYSFLINWNNQIQMQSEGILLATNISLSQDGDLLLFISTISIVFYFKVNCAIQTIFHVFYALESI